MTMGEPSVFGPPAIACRAPPTRPAERGRLALLRQPRRYSPEPCSSLSGPFASEALVMALQTSCFSYLLPCNFGQLRGWMIEPEVGSRGPTASQRCPELKVTDTSHFRIFQGQHDRAPRWIVARFKGFVINNESLRKTLWPYRGEAHEDLLEFYPRQQYELIAFRPTGWSTLRHRD